MQQLSVRGFDKQLARRIREIAKSEGLSLNRAALLLMRRGARLVETAEESATVGGALDSFIGKWSPDDERRLLDSIEACESVDEELWT